MGGCKMAAILDFLLASWAEEYVTLPNSMAFYSTLFILSLSPELPQQHPREEEEVLTDQQHGNQDWNLSPYQEDSESPQVKSEEEELCCFQDESELDEAELDEADMLMWAPLDEDDIHSEDEIMDFSTDEMLEDPVVNMPVITAVASGPNCVLQLLLISSHLAELS